MRTGKTFLAFYDPKLPSNDFPGQIGCVPLKSTIVQLWPFVIVLQWLAVCWLLQDVCVKKDFDDLYNKIIDDGRELKVIHGGVVEVTYQPVPSVRNNTLSEYPFGTPLQEKQAPAVQQDAPVPTQDRQVWFSFMAGNNYSVKV